MSYLAFSPQWAQAFQDEINRSERYREVAQGWKWRVGLAIEAEPDKGFAEAQGLVMDLYDGEAREVRVGTVEEARECDFTISASYSRWKQVATGRLDAIRGMILGKLKVKGSLPTIVRYAKASQELTNCTTRIPVQWPDEAG
ncbi:MAG: SCP2 sterol-binding domain-containing protein [Candidatus Dormibacteraceae bacterium]